MLTRAYVVAERGAPFELVDVRLDKLQPSEVLVEMLFTGVCHTDIVVQHGGMPIGGFPAVLGHEGLGIVKELGSGVSNPDLQVGDTVLLSFHTCRSCRGCQAERYGSCVRMTESNFINIGREKGISPNSPISLPDGTPVHGQFFGQSSLSKIAVVSETSVVKITARHQDLVYLAPLSCGYLTGAGTVINVLQPRHDSRVVVLGMGAVGLAAMLAAKALGVKDVIAVDLAVEKLQLASSLGAKYTINTEETDLRTAVRNVFPDGADYILDTTGVAKLLQASVEALGHEGTLALVGVPQATAALSFNALDLLLSCKRIIGVIEGFSNPQELIPKLLDLYYEGKFPIDKISTCYAARDLQQAVDDLKTSKVVKPVLSWADVQ